MPDFRDERLYDLLARWDQMRAVGQMVAAEELCRGCPELLQPLREHIAILQTMTWLEEIHDKHEERHHANLTLPDPARILSPSIDEAKDDEFGEIAMPLEALQRALVDVTLLSAAELRSVLRQRHAAAPLTSSALAQELLRRNKLTTFQLRLVLEGRGQELALGKYLLLDQIGAGGMGDVYRARHRQMNRIVAIKVLPRSVVDSPQAVDRFQREMRAIARLNHPNIVAAYDADQAGGRHFLVMQYVAGKDLSSLVRSQGPLSSSQALHCLIQAARGLNYAHQKGIIHRDIKPGNLILDAQGNTKVLDLGLARMRRDDHDQRSISSELTDQGVVMGTVDYMAPEQALDTHAADQRADIYSLGCTLHFLLTGQPPYRGPTLMARMIAHREEAIPSLRQRRPEVPECLDAAFCRMIAKKPEDRFQSMAEVLAELEACAGSGDGVPESHLLMRAGSWELAPAALAETSSAGVDPTIIKQPAPAPQPVPIITLDRRPGPQPLSERINRLKRPWLWLPVILAVIGLTVVGSQIFRSTPQGDDASKIVSNDNTPRPNPPLPAKPKEAAALPPIPTKSFLDQLDPATIPAAEKFPWQPKELVAVIGNHSFRHWGPCHAVAFHPDGKTIVSAGEDKQLRHWDLATLAEKPGITTERAVTFRMAWSADGKSLALGVGWYPAPAVYLWDVGGDAPRVKHTLPQYTRPTVALALSADGKQLAFAADRENSIQLYDLTGPTPRSKRTLLDHARPINDVAFVGNGKWLLSASEDGSARLWNLESGDDSEVLQQTKGPCRLAATPDGKRAALLNPEDDSIHIWDFNGAKPRREFVVKTGREMVTVALSPDGRRLAAASNIHLHAWDLEAGPKQLGQRRDAHLITCLAFDPQNRSLVSGHRSGYLRRWKTDRDELQGEEESVHHFWPVLAPATGFMFTQISGFRDQWDLSGTTPKIFHRYRSGSEDWLHWLFSSDGRQMVSYVPSYADVFRLHEWREDKLQLTLSPKAPENPLRIAISGDGKTFLSQHDRQFRLWRLEKQSLQAVAETISAYASGDSYRFWLSHSGDLVVAAGDSGVQVWEVAGNKLEAVPFPELPPVLQAFSITRDGRRIAVHSQAMQRLSFWERTEAGYAERAVVGKTVYGHMAASCFSPDGNRLFVSWDWNEVQAYDLTTPALLTRWKLPGPAVSLNMSDDGRHLILGNSNGTVYILRLASPPASAKPDNSAKKK